MEKNPEIYFYPCGIAQKAEPRCQLPEGRMPGEVVEKRRGETAKRKGERSMVHLGDVRNIDGGIAEPVDVIIGGSPCQDLSVAGEQKGFSGERSILFMDQIRIVREMREADEREGRTGLDVRPRFMVWENVPGAFSSNGGEDFRTVLQEIVRVKDKKVLVPRPPKGKWGGSRAYRGRRIFRWMAGT